MTYTDFDAGGLTYRYLDLFSVGKGVDVHWIKFQNLVSWAMTGAPTITMKIYNSFSAVSPPAAVFGLYAQQLCSNVVLDGKNVLAYSSNIAYNGTANNFERGLQNSSYTIRACLVASAGNVNTLSAGEMYIWVATIKTT